MRSLGQFQTFLFFFTERVYSHKKSKDAAKQKHKKHKKHNNANKQISDFFPLSCVLSA